MIPNMLAEVEQCKKDHPQAWQQAHTGSSQTEDFVKILAARLHAINSAFGLNGKRGNPNDLSDDALNFVGEGGGTTPDGRPCSVIDFIGAAGTSGAFPAWQVFGQAPEANGAWVKPGAVVPVPQPPPPAPSYPPYPGDAAGDAIGVLLWADYARAGRVPDPQVGRWFQRTIYDWLTGMTLDASIAKHRAEWCAALGIPPQ